MMVIQKAGNEGPGQTARMRKLMSAQLTIRIQHRFLFACYVSFM